MTRTVPRTRRRLAAAAVAVVLGVAATFGIATPAWAAIYMYHGPGSSYGMVDFDLIDDWMHLYTQSQTLATGKCLDTGPWRASERAAAWLQFDSCRSAAPIGGSP